MPAPKVKIKQWRKMVVYGGQQPLTCTASQTTTDSLNISKRGDFYPLYFVYTATNDSLLLQIRLANLNVFEIPVLIGLVAFKTIVSAYPYQVSVRMPAGQTVQFDFTDKSASTNYVYFAMHGFELLDV